MENLTAISKVIKKLKLKSDELLTKMLPIMHKLVDSDNEISNEIIYNLTKKNDKITLVIVTEWAQKRTSDIISDAEAVKKEIDNFAKTIASGGNGNKSIKKNIDGYPFLAEVWLGDVYSDKTGVTALQQLLDDIIENINNADEDVIIAKGTKHFNKK